MKRKISFAFVIMCFITLMSIGDIIGIFPSIFRLFKNFSLMNTVKTLCNIIITLTPVAIATLLYFNRKQDIKPKAYIVLIVCGCARLLRVVLNLSWLVSLFATPLNAIVPLLVNLSSTVLGFLFVVVAASAKSNKTNGAVIGLGFAGISLGLFLLIASIFPYLSEMGGPSFLSSLNIILLALGLWCLPKTFYDYDNCFFFGGNAVKLMCAIAAVVVFIMIVAGSAISSDDSNRGNCFNCGGDGWDSENHCSCVWCGGDGYASWNP